MRTPGWALALLEAVAAGKVERVLLGEASERRLRRHKEEAGRKRAEEVIGPER